MGCAGEREKIEDKMMLMKLERMEVQMEKEKELKKLSDIEGHTIKGGYIPDYIDPKFAKEKNIYDDDDGNEIDDKKTDANGKLDKLNKKDKKDKKKEKEKPKKEKDKKEKKEKDKKDKKDKKDNKDKKDKTDKKDKNDKKDKKKKK